MSVTAHSTITQAAMDMLADLANSKIPSPSAGGPFEFSYFDDAVLPPTDVVAALGAVTPGSGYSGDGTRVVMRVYSFKTVIGRRHYSKQYTTGTFVFPTDGIPEYSLDWTWTPPVLGADGYVCVFGEDFQTYEQHYRSWQEVATAGFNDTVAWTSELDADGPPGLPVSDGAWTKELSRIIGEVYDPAGAFFPPADDSWCVSGPWVCAVGNTLRLGQYRERAAVEFWYASEDSSDITVETYVDGPSGEVLLATDTYGSSGADVISPSHFGRVAQVTVDWSLSPHNILGTDYYLRLRAVGLDGVWVAKTWPAHGQQVYLDQDLPNYGRHGVSPFIAGLVDTSAPHGQIPDPDAPQDKFASTYPATPNRPALYPVWRDTDFLKWKRIADSASGGAFADAPVPFYPGPYTFARYTVTILPGKLFQSSLFMHTGDPAARVWVVGAMLPIWFNDTPPIDDSTASYTSNVAGGVMKVPDDFNPPTGQNFYYAVQNNTSASVTVEVRTGLFLATSGGFAPGLKPQFIKVGADGKSAFEQFSYNFAPSLVNPFSGLNGWTHNIPLTGYCVYELDIRRKAVGDPAKEPTVGNVDVAVGVMQGTTVDSAGTFVTLLSTTIPDGSKNIRLSVFWPVLEGTPLAYQSNDEVNILASVDFQPAVLADFLPPRLSQLGPIRGTFSGDPVRAATVLGKLNIMRWWNSTTRIDLDPTYPHTVTWPATATVYNDVEALLNAL